MTEGLEFVSADHDGKAENGVITWTIELEGGKPETVSFLVKVTKDASGKSVQNIADVTTDNLNGCLFIDCKNKGDFSDENTIIYGHHMASGKMFASLIKYADQKYFEEHPVMYLETEDKEYKVELFSGYTTEMASSAYMLTLEDSHTYAEWLRELYAKSDFKANVVLTTDDHMITLSTCAYSFQDARYVLHGKLTDMNE